MEDRINYQSPFTQYHRMHYNSKSQPHQPPQMPEQHLPNDFSNSLQQRIQANKYADTFKDEGLAGKSQRRVKKLKIFGIAEKRIRRQDCGTSILQQQKHHYQEAVKEQTVMLISSKTEYQVEPSSLRQIQQVDIWEQQQLQKLLYSSGSLANVPPEVMASSTARPEEICQNQTNKVLAEQTPIKLPSKRQENISVPSSKTILNNTNSNVFSHNHSNNSRFMILDMIQSKTLIQHESPKQSKIQMQSPRPNQKVIDEFDISPIMLNEVNMTRQMNETITKEEFVSLPISHRSRDQSENTKKKNESERIPAQNQKVKNIKRYLQDYGGYEQQIQKMIDKLEKVAQLKDKEQQIHKELGTLTHKKHQSVTNVSNYYFSHENQGDVQTSKKQVKRVSNEKAKKNKVFAQSSSNFKTNSDMKFDRQTTANYQLAKDVEKMEEILSKFKEISQTVSLDQRREKHQPERSVKDYVSNAQSNKMMFQSQKIGSQMNFYTEKVIMHPKAQVQVHLNQSQDLIQSQKPTSVQRQLFEEFDKKTTERKPTHLSSEKSKIKCQGKSHIEKSCGCKHEDLAIQIQRLNEKIQHLERQNKKTLRQAKSVEGLDIKEKKRPKEADEWSVEEEDIPILDQSIPKQKVQQAKTSKRNSHYCSDLKPFSVLKDAPFKRENSSKMTSKPPQNAKEQKHENSFTTQIDFDFLKISFPKLTKQLTRESSDRSIIKFGESMYLRFMEFAIIRQDLKQVTLEQSLNLKIKKYEDCIHFYADNSLEYHLIYYFKGKIYFGQWRSSSKCGDGYKHGYGYYENPRKYTYQGEFHFDKKHGRGTINYKNGDIYQGLWVNGKKQGEGILINVVGDIFKGMFKGGKKNGLGEERLKNGDFYRGQFKDGKLEGEGTYWWTDGSIYRGSFKSGLLHGMGIWMSKQNDYYEGEYRQNKKHGFGTYKWSNGMIFSGNFKDDEQVSLKTIEQQLNDPKTNRKSSQGIQKGSRFSKKSNKRI